MTKIRGSETSKDLRALALVKLGILTHYSSRIWNKGLVEPILVLTDNINSDDQLSRIPNNMMTRSNLQFNNRIKKKKNPRNSNLVGDHKKDQVDLKKLELCGLVLMKWK